MQQPVLPAQTTVDTAPVSNRTRLLQQGHTLPPVLPSAWKPAAQHAPQLTVDTAPVSNRAALFGAEEGEPDLALLAKKLEQLADLYREFTPAQKADVERLYRNDPAGLAVIQGRTTGGDWLKEQRRTEAARAAAAAQRKVQAARTLAADPAVQADAIRGKELLHTPGAAKAVTENTQPAYYSAEMFAADPRRAEVAAQRQMQYYKQALSDPVTIAVRNYGREIILPSGRRIPPEEQAQIITQAAAAYEDVSGEIGTGIESGLAIASDIIKHKKIPDVGAGRKAAKSTARKSVAVLDDLGEAFPAWLDTLGVVLDVAAGIEQNYQTYGTEVSDEKLCWDIIVDVVFSGGTALISTKVGAIVGTWCGNTLIGIVAGAAVGALMELLLGLEIDEQTAREWAKGLVE